ncbi:unnamed protein product [Phyllotreta striolata]|uniref:NAD(+) kinase n=1 Tax=Phyllotreta striolata TaxID=444603 RepID=A0A9N9XNH1_PHYSR|nr:unnamed protein product [Phyllotreta striolata]
MYKPRFLTRNIFSGVGNLNVFSQNISNEVHPLKIEKALIVSKLSRYESEKRIYSNCSEHELEKILRKRGTNYEKLVSFHELHRNFENNLTETLNRFGTEVEVVNRYNLTEEKVDDADIIIPIGGDGTYLLASSRVRNNKKPVIGFNSDPSRSEGCLCLPSWCSLDIKKSLEKLQRGQFKWLMRNRIRTTIENNEGDMLNPKCLHDIKGYSLPTFQTGEKNVLPVLALNEVFMGETLSARVSHLQLRLNGSQDKTDLKCSGICVCTGTGSTSWHLSINRLSTQCIAELLRLIDLDSSEEKDGLAKSLSDLYNRNLMFAPEDKRMGYTIRDLISSGVWPNPKGIKPRGFATGVEVQSHCFEAMLVVDGGVSFPFNDGAIAKLEIRPEDALRTVVFKE